MKTYKQVLKFVQSKAGFFTHGFRLPSGFSGGCYAVEHNGRIYHSGDTARLVEMICQDLNISTK